MKSLLCALILVSGASFASAGERFAAPGLIAPDFVDYAPVPVPDGVVIGSPTLPGYGPAGVMPGYGPAGVMPGYGGPGGVMPVALYSNVKVCDPHCMHPCAVPKIVEVPDPCDPRCTVCIEICVPPCDDCPCIKQRRRCVKYDYGKYRVEIKVRKGYLVVDYDS